MSLAYTFLLVILRNTLGKETLCTQQSLNKVTDHISAMQGDKMGENTHMVLKQKPSNSHLDLKAFLKI